jgi:hypothetical protein
MSGFLPPYLYWGTLLEGSGSEVRSAKGDPYFMVTSSISVEDPDSCYVGGTVLEQFSRGRGSNTYKCWNKAYFNIPN